GLALAALGFSFVFGISGIANFAYGAFYLLGGFITYILLNSAGFPHWVSAVISMVTIFFLGTLMYKVAIQRIRGAMLSEVIVTMGLGVTIIEILRWSGYVRHNQYLPSFVPGSITIGGLGIEYQRLIIVGIGAILFLLLWLLTRYTKIGLALRAMSQDELTALSLGINNDRIAMLAMGIGSLLAVVAALAIIPLGLLNIEGAYEILIFALAVGVLGGLGSTTGIIVGAFVLGYTQSIASTVLGPKWMMVVTFLAIVLVLLIKPSGIFGKQKELEERV
ncbi:MAG: branched-chain amino acid ABC transporter permease, partial [Chloroflexi bacterium]|nr:branched-chain amino acid ABC transporter permease [Chloroflexota bacterium]